MGAKPKVFINGISGLLGFHLAWRLRKDFLVSGTSFQNHVTIPDVQVFPINLINIETLDTLVRLQQPDFFINAIGLNDRAEVEKQQKLDRKSTRLNSSH